MPCLYDYIYSKGTDPPDEDQHGHAEATLTEKRRHCGRCEAFPAKLLALAIASWLYKNIQLIISFFEI
jgi:hypothetical protein